MVFESIKGEARAKKMILGAVKNKRISSSYIFYGFNSSEMADFAREFAKLLNCADLCGKCQNCKKIDLNIHPDFVVLQPEGKKNTIKIDMIRELKERVNIGPTEAEYLFITIIGADQIEQEAANSLLKILEEPPSKVVFVLIVSNINNLPKTVISRCQCIIFSGNEQITEENVGLPNSNSIYDLLQYSSSNYPVSKENDRQEALRKMESILYTLYRNKDFDKVYKTMNAVKMLKNNANVKIVFDHLFLSLGGWIR